MWMWFIDNDNDDDDDDADDVMMEEQWWFTVITRWSKYLREWKENKKLYTRILSVEMK